MIAERLPWAVLVAACAANLYGMRRWNRRVWKEAAEFQEHMPAALKPVLSRERYLSVARFLVAAWTFISELLLLAGLGGVFGLF